MAPPLEPSEGNNPQAVAEASQSGKLITGIIYPPPEIRNIVDKTASFVARNGLEFEARIKVSNCINSMHRCSSPEGMVLHFQANEAGNVKFSFLAATDPYHAYYQAKVKEFQEGKAQEPSAAPGPAGAPAPSGPTVPAKVQVRERRQSGLRLSLKES